MINMGYFINGFTVIFKSFKKIYKPLNIYLNMVSPYENNKDIKRDFGFSDIIIMIKILNSNREETYESQLSKEIGYSPSRISHIIRYLKKIKPRIIKNDKVMGSNKMLRINRSLLKHFIDEQGILVWLIQNFSGRYNRHSYKDY